ncbi:MAG: glycosyltransferase family 4 protein [Alphaproteobacteria bacterium]|nr:glycosyltransferase family 4 protein [Alphaproteobacteria bacterium]
MSIPSVLFINRVYPPVRGASGRVLRDLTQAFVQDGWDVRVLTTGSRLEKTMDGAVRVTRLKGRAKPSGLFSYLFIWLRLFVAVLFQPRADLVITLTDPPFLVVVGNLFKMLKGGRHIHWCQDVYPDILPALDFKFPGFMMGALSWISRRALRRADRVVVIGRCMARHLALTGINPQTMEIIPNWSDGVLGLSDSQGESLKTVYVGKGVKPYESQLKSDPKFRVLYAGNIGRAHPVDSILDAAEILNTQNPEIEFIFVGEGPGFDAIVRERARRGLENIRLMPWQPEERLRTLMESGDLHLISMKEEAAGMLVPCKLYAALASARPCIYIGPIQGEAGRVIRDFKAGSVLTQGKSEDLAEEIRRYRLNSEDWFSAQEGAVSAGQVYKSEVSLKAWIDHARTLLSARPPEAV